MTVEPTQPIEHVPDGLADWILGTRVPRGGLPPNAMRRYLAASLVVALAGIAASSALLGPRILIVAAVCAASALAVEILFAKVRHRPLNGGGVVYGLVLALLLPANVPFEMAALGAALAVLFGKEVFGGTGNQIFAPALVGKAALYFGYPTYIIGSGFSSVATTPDPRLWLALALVSLLAVALTGWARPANLRIIVAALVAAVCVAISMQNFGKLPADGIIEFLLGDSCLLIICLVACDPGIAPRDDEAKWLYGLMIGGLAVLMACFSNYTEATMSAVLVANLFAPTMDLLAAHRGKEVAA